MSNDKHLLTTIDDVEEYLTAQQGTRRKNPITLFIQMDFGIMTEENGKWLKMIKIIEKSGKYVNLDLSACTMNEDIFDSYESFLGIERILSIVLPDSTKIIGDCAFYCCYGIRKIIIPSSVTEIREAAFYFCVKLNEITLPSSLSTIGNFAFYFCVRLKEIIIPPGVIFIGEQAFNHCNNLKVVTISRKADTLKNAFMYELRKKIIYSD